MKRFFIFICSFVILLSLFSIVRVKALDNALSLTNITIADKSFNVGISKLKVTNNEVTNNMFFNKVGDFINYNVVITNNSDKDYYIRNIIDDSSNQYITYEYSNYKDKVVGAGNSITLNIKATYSTQSSTAVVNKSPINFSILYDDGSGILNVLNVNTGDHLLGYIILFVLSLSGLILTIIFDRKYIIRYLVIVLSIGLLIPLTTKADSNSLSFKLNNDITQKTVAELKVGREVNLAMQELSSGVDLYYDDTYSEPEFYLYYLIETSSDDEFNNTNVKYIKKATSEQYDLVKNSLSNTNIISTDESEYVVYFWFDTDTIYYYTVADAILLNADSACLFYSFSAAEQIDISIFNSSNVESATDLFAMNYVLTDLDLSNFVTYNVTHMESMFTGCCSLVSLDLANFDTSKVINMNSMFAGGMALETLNISSFDTRNVTDMSNMFGSCEKLEEVDVSSFNTSKVVYMDYMFSGCCSLESIDLSHFDTSNIKSLHGMFYECTNINNLDFSNFNTEKLEDISVMFYYCTSLTEVDFSNFVTPNLTSMEATFYNCSALVTVDLSGFDTSKVTTMYSLFRKCGELQTIYASESLVVNPSVHDTDMFVYCYKIVGGNGTVYDSHNVDSSYARIDGISDLPGYFTRKA